MNAGLNGTSPEKAWEAIRNGLLQGVTNIGINFATQELGLNPLLANIGFSAIGAALNAGIQVATGRSTDFFGSIFETYKSNALTFLGYADPKSPGYSWMQAAYISQILDFSKIIKEKGLVEALNIYGASFFNATAVNSIVQSGLTVGDYFKKELDEGRYASRTLKDGKDVKVVAVRDKDGKIITNVFFVKKENGTSFFWDVVGMEDFILFQILLLNPLLVYGFLSAHLSISSDEQRLICNLFW